MLRSVNFKLCLNHPQLFVAFFFNFGPAFLNENRLCNYILDGPDCIGFMLDEKIPKDKLKRVALYCRGFNCFSNYDRNEKVL